MSNSTPTVSLFVLRAYRALLLEGHQPETVEIDRNTPIFTCCLELKTCVVCGRPCNHRVPVLKVVEDLSPNHFTGSPRVAADVNTGPQFQQPNRQTPAQSRRGILN